MIKNTFDKDYQNLEKNDIFNTQTPEHMLMRR